MAKLAIKGHPKRGKEVIEILKMLGGDNSVYSGKDEFNFYFIDKNGCIKTLLYYDCSLTKLAYKIFHIEEFVKKYPHKVGDKVCFPDDLFTPFTINKMWWDENANELLCSFIEDDIEVPVVGVRAYKEKETIKTIPYMDYDVKADKGEEDIKKVAYLSINNKEYADEIEINLNDDYEYKFEMNRLYILKKKPFYPKTYEECCKAIGCDSKIVLGAMPIRYNILVKLEKLLICRDAYWKIAGDWKPDVMYCDLYCIGYDGNVITWKMQGGCRLLAFPTEEMRDAFYENFKEEIETCKEFL